ncbi:hypothetical protein LSH36_842g00027 [Paralvinella palmiformis]|uniref:pyridoxal kinase n=1 Tax=Paralvinella palmiformis TaxID=53620 RepID=A0AAD9IZH4_9ANNE|nr:hypothetical protein LSH36_842g00027 [Paralvinella palmiformis]
MGDTECRVLSIQSHVVSGYVGNKSAAFPLQVLGFEVDTINSVQFSNHTGYQEWKGHILNAEVLGDLYSGLKANDLCHYTHLLTGYIGCASFLNKVKEMVIDLKKLNPGLIYVCDPVMGDDGKLKQIIPYADIVTPNQFEAELLTGIKITNLETAKQAMNKLHEMGAKIVVISSTSLGSDDLLVCVGSSVNNGSRTSLQIDMPKLPAHFTGTGDLFTALLLAWLHYHSDNIKLACEKTVSTMQCVLKRTLAKAKEKAGLMKPTPAQIELQLIQSKRDIEAPEISCYAHLL